MNTFNSYRTDIGRYCIGQSDEQLRIYFCLTEAARQAWIDKQTGSTDRTKTMGFLVEADKDNDFKYLTVLEAAEEISRIYREDFLFHSDRQRIAGLVDILRETDLQDQICAAEHKEESLLAQLVGARCHLAELRERQSEETAAQP